MADITKTGTETAKEGLAGTANDPSAQILRAIEIVEGRLREKRDRIEEIQMRCDHLVNEIAEVNKALEFEGIDFVQKFDPVIAHFDTDGAIMGLLSDIPATAEASDLDTESARRDREVRGSPDDKQAKSGSRGWLKKKGRARRKASKPLIPDPEDSG